MDDRKATEGKEETKVTSLKVTFANPNFNLDSKLVSKLSNGCIEEEKVAEASPVPSHVAQGDVKNPAKTTYEKVVEGRLEDDSLDNRTPPKETFASESCAPKGEVSGKEVANKLSEAQAPDQGVESAHKLHSQKRPEMQDEIVESGVLHVKALPKTEIVSKEIKNGKALQRSSEKTDSEAVHNNSSPAPKGSLCEVKEKEDHPPIVANNMPKNNNFTSSIEKTHDEKKHEPEPKENIVNDSHRPVNRNALDNNKSISVPSTLDISARANPPLESGKEAETPRGDDAPKRKRLGWGQGLARLHSMPEVNRNSSKDNRANALSKDKLLDVPRSHSYTPGERLDQKFDQKFHSRFSTESMYSQGAPVGDIDQFKAANAEYRGAPVISDTTDNESFPKQGIEERRASKVDESVLSTSKKARPSLNVVTQPQNEFKENSKSILHQIDVVDGSISKLEGSLKALKSEYDQDMSKEKRTFTSNKDLEKELSKYEGKLKNESLALKKYEGELSMRGDAACSSSESDLSESEEDEEDKEKANSGRPFLNVIYDRKELVKAFYEDNRKRAEKANGYVDVIERAASDTNHSEHVDSFHKVAVKIINRNCESHAKVSEQMLYYLKSKRKEWFDHNIDLSLKYMKVREQWRHELSERKKCAEKEKSLASPRNQTGTMRTTGSSRLRSSLSSGIVRSEYEEMKIISRLQAAEKMKTMIRIPNMILDPSEKRWKCYKNTNSLVTDPMADLQNEKRINSWTSQEKRIFFEKYSQFPKDFSKIASFLEHRTVADCIVYYYKNQKSDEFASIRRKHQLKKRRLYSEAKKMGNFLNAGPVKPNANTLHKGHDDKRDKNKLKTKNEKDSAKMKKDMNEKKDSKKSDKGKGNPSKTQKKDSNKSSDKKGNDDMYEKEWSVEEVLKLQDGIRTFGKDFKKLSQKVETKSVSQIKYFFSRNKKNLSLDVFVENYMRSKGKIPSSKKAGKNDGKAEKESKESKKASNKGSKSKAKNAPAPSKAGQMNQASAAFANNVIRGSGNAEQGVHQPLNQLTQAQQLLQLTLAGLAGHNFGHNAQQSTGILQGLLPNQPGVLQTQQQNTQPAVAPQPLLDAATLTALQALLASAGFTLQPSSLQNMGFMPQLMSDNTQAQNFLGALNLQQGLLNPMNHQQALMLQQHLSNTLQNQARPVNSVQQPVTLQQPSAPKEGQKRQISYWAPTEKEIFMETFKMHGRDWNLLSQRIPGKTLNQIKTFYQNYKQKLGLDKIQLPDGAIGPRKRVRKNGEESSKKQNQKSGDGKKQKTSVASEGSKKKDEVHPQAKDNLNVWKDQTKTSNATSSSKVVPKTSSKEDKPSEKPEAAGQGPAGMDIDVFKDSREAHPSAGNGKAEETKASDNS